jgi:NNP family nitrate/nitrite transporter-like MFS transporter
VRTTKINGGYSSDVICLSAPVLIFVAVLTLIYGTDHPAGKWSERHKIPATEMAIEQGHDDHDDRDEKKLDEKGVGDTSVTVRPVEKIASIDVAVNKRLTFNAALQILASPVTWLPALAYLTTFGVELAIDSQMSNVLFGLYSKKIAGFDQTTAGYYTSIL